MMRYNTNKRCWSTWLLTLASSIIFMVTLEKQVTGAFNTIYPTALSHRSKLSSKLSGVVNQNDNFKNEDSMKALFDDSMERRAFIGAAASVAGLFGYSTDAEAFSIGKFGKRVDILLMDAKKNATASAIRAPISSEFNSAEQCLLRLLPVKNPIFRRLESDIESISIIRFAEEKGVKDQTWAEVANNINATIKYFDGQRVKLQPVFNPEDSAELQIAKGERGEQLAESLRDELVSMLDAAITKSDLVIEAAQRRALLALANIGELLVPTFPYNVPKEGKFSYLPRLLGRARVTFTIKRKEAVLGNITMIADGYAAPITAGNFVDLCIRQFYTGLPVKAFKKRLGSAPTLTGEDNVVKYDIENAIENVVGEQGLFSDALAKLGKMKITNNTLEERSDSATTDSSSGTVLTTMPILGSFQEGFYDPLTAKPRRIPLEIVQFDRLKGTARLSYAGKQSDLLEDPSTPADPNKDPLLKPVLNFNVPGLVAMNHPDKNLNGGSSEFFSLQKKDQTNDKFRLLTGQYAPFGYIVEGGQIMDSLLPGDVISATYVSEWGALNLVKIRGTSFSDVLSSSSENSDED